MNISNGKDDNRIIQQLIEKAGVANVVKTDYTDVTADTFRKLEKADTKEQTAAPCGSLSSEDAYVSGGDLDWSVLKEKNLPELFCRRKHSRNKLYYYEKDSMSEETYEKLYSDCLKTAEHLRISGMKPGSKAIMLIPYKKMFLEAFWGCIFCGIVPAPLGVFQDFEKKSLDSDKLYQIWKMLEKPVILTTEDMSDAIGGLGKLYDDADFRIVSMDNTHDSGSCNEDNLYPWSMDETSILLFTSGSTGIPKGVGLTQRNIFARTLGEIEKFGLTSEDVDCNWMTFTHAAGLIWSHIRDLYLDIPQVQVQSEFIVRSPYMWMKLINDYRATVTWAPNFAFSLVLDQFDPEMADDWDLSCLRYAFAAGEANISKTLRNFLKLFEPYGMRKDAVVPSFGMTETSSCITYYETFSYANSKDSDEFLPVGNPMPGIKVRIRDDNGNILKEKETGKVELTGETVTAGYYNNEKANSETFTEDGWLITGDLGYISDEQLVLTGREKDIIIINGLNYYVQDFEAAVDEMDEVNSSYTAATSIQNSSGEEVILIFFCPAQPELVEDERYHELRFLCDQVRNKIREKCKINPDYVIPISPKESIRTDIGKKQRGYYQKKFRKGDYDLIIERLGEKRVRYFMEQIWEPSETELTEQKRNAAVSRRLLESTEYDAGKLDIAALYDILTEEIGKTDEMDADELIFVTENSIVCGSGKLNCCWGALWGLVKTFNLENNDIKIRMADFDRYDEALMEKELRSGSADDIVAYRNGVRMVPALRTMPPESVMPDMKDMDSSSLVMIAGGLGGIGRLVTEYVLSTYGCSAVITGSSSITAHQDTFDRLRQVSEDIIYCTADVRDADALASAAEAAEERFGRRITHILNFSGRMCLEEDRENYFDDITAHTVKNEKTEAYRELADIRLSGTYNLEKIRSERDADMWLFYSITSQFGGTSLGAYTTSNAWQEQYGRYLAETTGKVNTAGLSMWRKTGMNQDAQASEASSANRGFYELEQYEGVEYIGLALRHRLRNPLIGINRNAEPIRAICRDDYEVHYVVQVESDENRRKVKDMLQDRLADWKNDISCTVNKVLFAARSEENVNLEDQIREIWSSVLNVEEIERFDNIFDLGGNSLSIYQISSRMTEELGVSIKPIDLMTYTSISELASYMLMEKIEDREGSRRPDNSERISKRKKLMSDRRRKRNS